jgi:hypothetical protein
VLLSTLLLSLLNCPNRGIVRCADGAFHCVVALIEAFLVKRMFAKEVDGGKIKVCAAG